VEPVGRLGWIQVDCADPVALAAFWGEVLGVDIGDTLGEPPHYVGLAQTDEAAPVLSFQRVADAKSGKNRLHFDIAVDDIESATHRIEQLGGRPLAAPDIEEYGFRWRIMTDPEDNEFCLIF
jgi:predicted enzyme related to lactoylglutathione lyase